MKKYRLITILILILTMLYTVYFNKKQSINTKILDKITLPIDLETFQQHNNDNDLTTTDKTKLKETYFQSMAYKHQQGDILYLTLIDGTNFHHPKTCYKNSGYTIKDLNDNIFIIKNKEIRTYTLLLEKANEKVLMFYWIVLNKEIIDWNKQKVEKFLSSLQNKNTDSLFIRIDIPIKNNIAESKKIAQEFITELSNQSDPNILSNIFGRIN